MFSAQINSALSAPLDRAFVKEREQSGRRFSYIEGWHAIAEANRIFGFDGWHRETVELRLVNERPRKIGRDGRDGWAVSYVVRVRVIVGDVIRDGMGSGHGIDTDCGLAHESAIKEAETDAMKRALMTFGNPFGLALYDKEQRQVIEFIDPPQPPQIPVKVTARDAQDLIDEIGRMKTIAGLQTWWRETTKHRENLGIVEGSDDYKNLLKLCGIRKTQIAEGNL